MYVYITVKIKNTIIKTVSKMEQLRDKIVNLHKLQKKETKTKI